MSDKIVIVRNYFLRKIRDNFRNLWLLEVVRRQDLINIKERKILFYNDGRLKPSRERSKSKEHDLSLLQDEWWGLERLKRRSICECSLCGDVESDRFFDSRSNNWICVNCDRSRRKFS